MIGDGYQTAAEKGLELLAHISRSVVSDDRESLLKIATTSMQSKLVSEDSGFLSELIVDAILKIARKTKNNYSVDLDNLKVEKKSGGSIEDTSLIKGIVLDKEVVHSGMPTKIQKARIALVNCPLAVSYTHLRAHET